MGQVGSGPIHHEEVGEAGHGDPQICGRPLAPQGPQVHSVPAGDAQGGQYFGGPEPGGVHQHVGRVPLAVDGDHGVGLDVVDPGAHQLHVVAHQGRQPRPVVLQGALAGGRVVGHHLGRQLRVIGHLAEDPVGEHLAGELVGFADGSVLIGVVRVHPGCLQALVASGPEDKEPVPPAVKGEVAQRPQHAGADGGVVVRVGEHPLGRPLEHGQVADLGGNRGGDLEPAGPGPDHGYLLAGEVDVVVPPGRVEGRPGKGVGALDHRQVRAVELAHSRYHGPSHQDVLGAVRGPGAHRPCRGRVVPGRTEDFGLPPHVGLDPVLVHDPLEVALQLGLLGVVLGPVVAGLEAVTVEVVADVDPGPGVGVLPPGAAHSGVLLHDGEGDAGLRQPDAGQQTGLPTPNDHHWEGGPVVWVASRLHPAGIATVELHLLHQERDVLGGDVLAHQPSHHLLEEFGGHGLRLGTAAVAVVPDDLEGQGPGLVLVLLGHVALHLVEEQAGRPQPAPDDLGVAGHVDQREEQRGDAYVQQGGRDLLISGVERLACMGVAHGRHLSWPEGDLAAVASAQSWIGVPQYSTT